MSQFKAITRFWIQKCREESCMIDPHDFLYCESRFELREAVHDYMLEQGLATYSFEDIDHIVDSEFAIPDEFLAAWEKLKFAK